MEYCTVYAFDVDETLECGRGPICDSYLFELHKKGHIVGLNGNWAVFTATHPTDWHRSVSFVGPIGLSKAAFLKQIQEYVIADDYVMVGNDPERGEFSDDRGAAREAEWRFIHASDFASGKR